MSISVASNRDFSNPKDAAFPCLSVDGFGLLASLVVRLLRALQVGAAHEGPGAVPRPPIGLKCSPSATKHHQRPRVKAKPKPKFRLSAAAHRSLPASTQNQWVFLFGGSRGLLPSWHGQLGWRREVTAGVQSLDRARTIQAVKYSRDKTLWKTDRLVCVTPADLTGRAERQRKDG